MMKFIKKISITFALIIALFGGVPGGISIYNHFFSGPGFSVQPVFVMMGNIMLPSDMLPSDSTEYTHFFISLSISNQGNRPLTPTSFDLKLKYQGNWISFDRKLIPEKFIIHSELQNIKIEDPWLKDLQRFNGSIQYAEPINGFLMFITDKISLQELISLKEPTFQIICSDIFGEKHYFTREGPLSTLETGCIYPKHGVTVTPLEEKHPTSNIDSKVVKDYYEYFLPTLRAQPEIIEYLKNNMNSPLIYPEIIQVLVTTTGTVMIHNGYKKNGNPKIEFYSFNIPYQKAMFGENMQIGKPALQNDLKFSVFNGLVIGQNQVKVNYPSKIDSIGGHGLYGERLIDVNQNADVTLLNCYFHYIRENSYESLYKEYIYINGSTDSSILSKSATDERIRHLCSIFKNRKP